MADKQLTIGSTFTAGIWSENPVLRLLLGMCPTLAVTTGAKAALTMGLSVIFVLICSNLVVSLMRNLLKPHLRIMMFTLTIATFVTIADLFLKAYLPEMSAKLGPYIPLIIVNCIIICRAEACASKNGPWISVIDGLAYGIGFTVVLCILASIREVLSTGRIFETVRGDARRFCPLGGNGNAGRRVCHAGTDTWIGQSGHEEKA
jgi:Predicted NADH:ubiquinone oxidoreductase, subunit RnfE